jgi:hypothetical protein
MDTQGAWKYITRIRNGKKRMYAKEYWRWIRQGRIQDPPRRPADLGTMAAQAVRMMLEDFE